MQSCQSGGGSVTSTRPCFELGWNVATYTEYSKKCRNRRFRASKVAKCFSPLTMIEAKLRKFADFI